MGEELETLRMEATDPEDAAVVDPQSKPILLPSSPYTTNRIDTQFIQIPSSPPVVRTSEVQIIRRKSDDSAYSQQAPLSEAEVLSEMEFEGSSRSFETESEEYADNDETMRLRIYNGVLDEVSSLDEPAFEIYTSSDADTIDDVEHEIKAIDVLREYTPRTARIPFRTPSSVRNVQLDTTPPHLRTPTSHRLSKGSLPRSIRSSRSRLLDGSPRRFSPTKRERPSIIVKEHPLVLLHITLLPLRTLPPDTQAHLATTSRGQETLTRYHRLQTRFSTLDTVLTRGILIAHPREDYDVLIERVLESLELEDTRVRPCGHFISPDAPDAGLSTSCRHENFSEIEGLDAPRCDDCFAPILSRIDHAASVENRRWDVKVFASNGLMSPGAWSAAWREMERVDIEVGVWCDKDFDLISEWKEESVVELEQGLVAVEEHHTTNDEMENRRDEELHETERQERKKRMSDERRREIYGDLEPQGNAIADTKPTKKEDISLPKLLVTALRVFLLDSRNVALSVLSILVLGLAWSLAMQSREPITKIGKDIGQIQEQAQVPEVLTSMGIESLAAS